MTDHATRGMTDHATRGMTDRAARGMTDHATRGMTDRAARGMTDHAARGMTDHATRGMTDRAARGMTTAACAANDDALRANDVISSLPAPVIVGKADLSLPPEAARHCAAGASSLPPKAASSFADGGAVGTIGPLLAVRRESTRGAGRREPRILEAVEIIRREACDGLTVAALAAKFKCSRRLFDMRFREATGHSARDEIEHVRFENAFTLLKGTDKPVSAIADFCGYRTGSALRHIFLARTGMSMREWRARNFWK